MAKAILDMDFQWSAQFGDIGLNDLNYSDLFLQMWAGDQTEFPKTALYEFMPGVSRRTAVAYVQRLIDENWLLESAAQNDRRIRYVRLSPEIADRLERFLAFVHLRFAALDKV
ncbi:MarR family transcriptional regulator [Paraburkholderia silviterrae]|uniref:MarR family transcriptional regulator n=1 Tax=Paraburkholderia silviterrae TaxID=2528715 RepID=UPI001F10A784|nr:MarR family transcriptional regulator [Paraburkholderia silviterrae]